MNSSQFTLKPGESITINLKDGWIELDIRGGSRRIPLNIFDPANQTIHITAEFPTFNRKTIEEGLKYDETHRLLESVDALQSRGFSMRSIAEILNVQIEHDTKEKSR